MHSPPVQVLCGGSSKRVVCRLKDVGVQKLSLFVAEWHNNLTPFPRLFSNPPSAPPTPSSTCCKVDLLQFADSPASSWFWHSCLPTSRPSGCRALLRPNRAPLLPRSHRTRYWPCIKGTP